MSGRRAGLPWPGAEVAAVAEAAGVTAFCTGEFADNDAYVTTTQMAAATQTAHIGPGIAYAFSRTPFAHAAALRQLHKIAGDRLFAGLGSGAFRVNRDWFGVPADRPLARMSELVQVLRAYLHAENGERIAFSGEFYEIKANVQAPVLGRLDIPILVGAFNAKMCAATGKVADGVIGHGLFTTRWWDEVVRPAVADGVQAAGRNPADLAEQGWVITAIDDEDPQRAVDDARRMIGFYLTVKTYDPMVELFGWGAAVAAIRSTFAKGDMPGMVAAVTDDMVEQIAVCGTTAEARQLLAAKGDGLARDVVFLAPPSFLVSERRRAAYARSSLALLSSI